MLRMRCSAAELAYEFGHVLSEGHCSGIRVMKNSVESWLELDIRKIIRNNSELHLIGCQRVFRYLSNNARDTGWPGNQWKLPEDRHIQLSSA